MEERACFCLVRVLRRPPVARYVFFFAPRPTRPPDACNIEAQGENVRLIHVAAKKTGQLVDRCALVSGCCTRSNAHSSQEAAGWYGRKCKWAP